MLKLQGDRCTVKYAAHIDGLVLERCNSSALAMELHLSCTNPSMYTVYIQLKSITDNVFKWCIMKFMNTEYKSHFDDISITVWSWSYLWQLLVQSVIENIIKRIFLLQWNHKKIHSICSSCIQKISWSSWQDGWNSRNDLSPISLNLEIAVPLLLLKHRLSVWDNSLYHILSVLGPFY